MRGLRINFRRLSLTALSWFVLMASMTCANAAGVPLAGSTPAVVRDGTAKLIGHYAPGHDISVVIGLEHPHLAAEEAFLKELGTKGSPNFHKFLTADQWNQRFAPSAADEQAVIDWAQSQGLSVNHRFNHRLALGLQGPAAKIEAAFAVTLNAYQVGSRTAYSNTADPVLPTAVKPLIHSISGLNNIHLLAPASKPGTDLVFPDVAPGPAKTAAGSGAQSAKTKPPFMLKGSAATGASGAIANFSNGAYDPTDIYSSQAYDVQALYNQGHCCNPLGNSGVTPPNTSIAVATAGVQDPNDFVGFHNLYPYLAYHYQQYYIGGTPTTPDNEGTMDFEWSTAWSNSFGSYVDTSMVYLYDGVDATFGTFIKIFGQILADGNAKVMSTSWGCEEVNCWSTSDMDSVHGIFNSMVGQGMTLIAASGDTGSVSKLAGTSTTPGLCDTHLGVSYPASDPDVVAAGGTTLTSNISGGVNYYLSESGWTGGPAGCNANDGGSGGGTSAYFGQSYGQFLIGLTGNRQVPDLALNADWYNTPQNYFFGGSQGTNGGTSIVAPSLAGLFAQTNAYLDFVQNQNGSCSASPCGVLGRATDALYWFYYDRSYAPHYPYYDITSGCNNNDYTQYYQLGYYCAGTGYDQVTGLGSINALQLTRAIIAYFVGDFAAPTTSFAGPSIGHWYNTDQTVSWSVTDAGGLGFPATGVSGFSQSWDSFIFDAGSEAAPGSGDSFYSGPQFPNATGGYLNVSWAGQGCHTANVRSWDNSGYSGYQTYGPVCYDTIAPVTTRTLTGSSLGGSLYASPVTVSLAATDASSGVAATYVSVDGAPYHAYSGSLLVSGLGTHTVSDYSDDVAGNVEAATKASFTVKSKTTSLLTASASSSIYGAGVTFTATVHATTGATPAGTVTFKNGAATLGTATLSGGKAALTTGALPAGSHSITVDYTGSATDLASVSAALGHTVTKAATTTTLASSLNPATVGKSVTFTATVKGAHGGSMTGTVTFKNGTATLGTGAVNSATGKATFATAKLTKGTHGITASYGGSANTTASTSTALSEVVK